MKQRTVVILNGPPESGKDAIASRLKTRHGFIHLEMKTKLHELALTISGIRRTTWFKRYRDRKLREEPWDKLPVSPLGVLHHMSQREYMIYISEKVIKPNFGKDYFGLMALEEIKRYKYQGHKFVFSDGGFQEEIDVFFSDPSLDVKLVHLYREGCTFDNDSRSYISYPGSGVNRIYNTGTVEEACKKVLEII